MKAWAILGATLSFGAGRLAAAGDVLYPRAAAVTENAGAGQSYGMATWVAAFALALAGGWLLWNSRRRARGAGSRGKLAVLESRSLGNRQYLVVASYGQQKFLLGVCVGRISLLSPLDEGKNAPAS